MWFMNGVKPHKHLSPLALKGQKLLAQGNALGINSNKQCALYGQKLCYSPGVFDAFALTGRQPCAHEPPRAMPWARGFCPFRACVGKPTWETNQTW